MKFLISRATLACGHAASLQTQLAIGRWQGQTTAMPQSRWQQSVQHNLLAWLQAGGFCSVAPNTTPQTKTAAKGRRSLASQRDSNEEFQFTLFRIHDAAE